MKLFLDAQHLSPKAMPGQLEVAEEEDPFISGTANFINSHEFIYSHREVSNRNSMPWLLAMDP